jgi:hypothetical protein
MRRLFTAPPLMRFRGRASLEFPLGSHDYGRSRVSLTRKSGFLSLESALPF